MNLLDFVQTKMKMSHIYQPVMIRSLLVRGGWLKVEEIAQEFLLYDNSQIQYYIHVTNNMVGKVLRNHEIVLKEKDIYKLLDYDTIPDNIKVEIIRICEERIDQYIKKRGDAIWNHRSKNRRAIPGSIRYQVLKRAKFRCELCGISADEKALEVDHIVPKNLGGEDSINNYQALCYTCNSQKRDTDSTSFREPEEFYGYKNPDCIFCKLGNRKIEFENNLAIAFYDLFPVTEGHLLIIPKRHAKDYFELKQAEINAINEIISMAREKMLEKDKSIQGFNIGINNGKAAGQTIFHSHIHLIPRREGDVVDPRGGVRHVIPGKGKY